jgi:hypothetical protein
MFQSVRLYTKVMITGRRTTKVYTKRGSARNFHGLLFGYNFDITKIPPSFAE